MHRHFDFPFENLMNMEDDMFSQWISFFPTAPLFGVPWRFAPKGADLESMWNPWAAWMPKAAWAEKSTPRTMAPKPAPAPAKPAASARPVAVAEIVAQAAPARAEPAKAAAPAAQAVPDDLKRIKGIGPKLAADLAALGVTSFAQIAAFTAEDLARIDAALGSVKGRCYRDDWVGQARALTA